jgi:hypothetical protein
MGSDAVSSEKWSILITRAAIIRSPFGTVKAKSRRMNFRSRFKTTFLMSNFYRWEPPKGHHDELLFVSALVDRETSVLNVVVPSVSR